MYLFFKTKNSVLNFFSGFLRNCVNCIHNFIGKLYLWDCRSKQTSFFNPVIICIGNSMICSDIWHKYQK